MSSCLLCKSHDLKLQFPIVDQYGDRYEWVKCSTCSTYFLDPQPTKEQLKRAYAHDYYGEGDKKFNPTVEKVLDLFRSQKAKDLSKRISDQASVLDIGCADGEFLHQLKKLGNYDLHGIELEGKAAERAKERGGFQLSVGVLKESSYPKHFFDLVTLIHVFEHLPDPVKTVSIISNIIKEEGLVYIEQPNIGSWQAQIFKDRWLHLDPPRHLNLLPEQTLVQLMNEHGFQLVKRSYFSPQFSPFGVQQSLLNFLFSKRELLYESLKGNKEYVKEYSSFSLFMQKLFHWLTFPIFIFTDLIASFFKKGGTIKLVFRK